MTLKDLAIISILILPFKQLDETMHSPSKLIQVS